MKKANLEIENRQGEFLFSNVDIQEFNGKVLGGLIEFKESQEPYDECAWGQIGLHRSKANSVVEDAYILQFRAKQALRSDEPARNLIAVVHLTLSQLRTILEVAESVAEIDIDTNHLEVERLRARVQELEEEKMALILRQKEIADTYQSYVEG